MEEKLSNDDISLKDLSLKIRQLLAYLKSNLLLLVVVTVLGALLGLAYAFVKKPRYTATSTFVLEEGSKAGGLGQYAGLASLAGIDLMGANGGGIFQGDNILQLYRSRVMLEKTLLTEVVINGKRQKLIDRYIDFLKLRDRWKEDEKLISINFNADPSKFNRTQDSIVTDIINTLNKSALNVDKFDKKLSIINVSITSKDEVFAKEFNTKLVETVNEFYTQTKTKKSTQNVRVLQRQADSVRAVLNSSISGVASAIDAAPNANPALLTLKVPSQRRQVDVQASSAIYGEIVKNLELSKMSLRQETPLVQIIDEPVFPLTITKVSKPKGFIIGAFLGALISFMFLTVKLILKSI